MSQLVGLAKKQTVVSLSSTEAETFSLDACLRLKRVTAVILWDMHNIKRHKTKSFMADKMETDSIESILPNSHISNQRAALFGFE